MKGLLLIGGEAPERKNIEKYIRDAGMIIAADSGFDTALEMGIKPTIIIGDMDSIKRKDILKKVPEEKVFKYSENKDETDTEIGLKMLYEKDYKDVTIIGGGGGRLDHIIALISLFDRKIRPKRWFTKNEKVLAIDNKIELKEMKNKRVSFFPVGRGNCEMKTKGLKWPLDSLIWKQGDVGISNLIIDNLCSIEMIKGRLIVVSDLHQGV